MVLDEPIRLTSHDPRWRDIAQVEGERLSRRLNVPQECIEHIGSTAVQDLMAKPIIDLMLGLERYPPTTEFIAKLESLSYESLGEAGVPGRMYFRSHVGEPINLHLVSIGGEHWQKNLAFRELLKAEPVYRKRYEQAKIEIVEAGHATLLEYSAAKSAVIDELLSKIPAA
jgi:GrpB-like predicted nucleotidyltransferase (UPF0157 family)